MNHVDNRKKRERIKSRIAEITCGQKGKVDGEFRWSHPETTIDFVIGVKGELKEVGVTGTEKKRQRITPIFEPIQGAVDLPF